MPVLVAGFAIVLFTLTSLLHVASTRAEISRAQRAATAISFRHYARFVNTYVRNHPSAHGEIATANLGLPTWYSPRPSFRNYVADGVGFSYMLGESEVSPETLLVELTPTCIFCGLKKGSSVITLAGKNLGSAPKAITEGRLVNRQ